MKVHFKKIWLVVAVNTLILTSGFVAASTDTAVSIDQVGDGIVKTNVVGEGGALSIVQQGSGNTFVNAVGLVSNLEAATISGTAALVNAGTGTLALTQATGTVRANVSGDGTLIIHNAGVGNSVFVNAEGNRSNATPINNGGTLTLNSDGFNNSIIVTSFTAGVLTINQNPAMSDSMLTLSGGSATNAIINQNGSYQDATIHSVNGSTGTVNLNVTGQPGAHATLDITL